MNIEKLIREGIDRLARPFSALWRTVFQRTPQQRQQREVAALEAERLDRIRNPSKYLGKS
jgi:hypothetical protein